MRQRCRPPSVPRLDLRMQPHQIRLPGHYLHASTVAAGCFPALGGSVRGGHRASRPYGGAFSRLSARPTTSSVALTHTFFTHHSLRHQKLRAARSKRGGGRCGEPVRSTERGGSRRFVAVTGDAFCGWPGTKRRKRAQNGRFAAETRRRRLGNWLSHGAPC